MNDTIRKLAQEADVWCDQNCIDHPFYNVQWEQKFTELIVRECVKQMENSFAGSSGTENKKEVWAKSADTFSAWNNAIKYSRDQIKQHFGVE